MSPRAAWQLDAYGFRQVFDFVRGKVEWLTHGLPSEGTGPHHATAGAAMKHDVPTCLIGDTVAEARGAIALGDQAFCVVVNQARVVLGRIRRRDLPDDDARPVLDVMKPGPATVRPAAELGPLTERMYRAGVKTVLVTTTKGILVGVVHRDAADRYLEEHEHPAAGT